jgi:integrase
MGSVYAYESKAGKRYRVLYRKPDHSQGQKRGFTTKKAAQLYLASMEVAKARGEFVDASASRITVGALGEPWLVSLTHLKPSSLEPIQIAWRLYVEPRWGSVSLSGITHTDVQTWVSQLTLGTAKTGHPKPGPRSPTVVLRAYGVLAAILDAAVADRRLVANPARGVSLPRKVKKPRVYLSHAQVELLASSAGKHGTLVEFLAYTGLRWGEAIGLRVRSIDTLKRRVSITENAVRVGGKIIVGTPKTHASRAVPYPEFLTLPLARACAGKSPEALVFGAGLVHLNTPSSMDGWFEAAIALARKEDPTFPRLTLHELRHTAASLSISAGANVKVVQRMMGHASAAMTLDTYADLFDSDLDTSAVALDAARSASNVANSLPRAAETQAVVTQLPRR